MRAFLEASWRLMPWLLLGLIALNLAWSAIALLLGGAPATIPFLTGLIAAAVMLALWAFVDRCW